MKEIYYIFILALLFLGSCTKHDSAQREQAPIKVKTMVVAPQENGAVSRYVGAIEPAHSTPLSLQTTGRVVEIAVKNGQRVTQGQTILAVDNTQALNALRTAEASLRHAQDGFDRVSKVHDKGVVSDQKMVEIESQLAQARSLYEAAQQQLKECTLTAPCEGVIDGLNMVIGQTVLPGTTLCTILDMRAYSVRFTVPEAEIGALPDKGQVVCEAIHAELPITITERGITANPLTHTYEVVADIKDKAEGLKAGMVAVVKLKANSQQLTASQNIVIPANCILLKPEGATVWVVEDGKAARRLVTVDGYQADGVRVTEGLQEGDQLITEGYQKLYNGCLVENE
ncbi:MAG: efflux RND transporter periplasmic adaptor subunit [Paludibacteraceae bacterium]|nr:efflux RND transporter periplasmic adaptor subunit [Paludibacteraceae bacterium]